MIAGDPSEEPVGLREQKKQQARVAISAAAIELCRKHGFDSVTIDRIAERAGVSRRTYFRYFSTKEMALLDRRLRQLEAFRAQLADAPPDASAMSVVTEALRSLANDYRKNRTRILEERRLFAVSPEVATKDLAIDRELERAIAEAVVPRTAGRHKQRSARFFAAAAIGVVRALLDEWEETKGELDLVKVGEPALESLAGLLK